MIFECDKCGLCCRHIDLIPGTADAFICQKTTCAEYIRTDLKFVMRKECTNYIKDKMSEEEYVCLNKLGYIRLKKLDGIG